MATGILKQRRNGASRRAEELQLMLDSIEGSFASNILSVGALIAHEVARLAEQARHFSIGIADLIVAATAEAHGLVVLTRNMRHFAPTGVASLDPLAELPPDVPH
jgi:toxin FitB